MTGSARHVIFGSGAVGLIASDAERSLTITTKLGAMYTPPRTPRRSPAPSTATAPQR